MIVTRSQASWIAAVLLLPLACFSDPKRVADTDGTDSAGDAGTAVDGVTTAGPGETSLDGTGDSRTGAGETADSSTGSSGRDDATGTDSATDSTGSDGTDASESSSTGDPATWTCFPNYYGTGDGCDCGCGIIDPDCADATVASCEYCDDPGSCGTGDCPANIDPNDNATCVG